MDEYRNMVLLLEKEQGFWHLTVGIYFFLNPVEYDCLVLSIPSVSAAFSLLCTLYADFGALN